MNGQNTNNYVNNGPAFSSNQVVSGNQAMTKVKTRYKYVAYDKNGKQVKGYFDAFRRMDVESFLTAQGYKILDIKAKKISKAGEFFTFSNEMKYKDLVFFLTQLSTYIKSGIPLTESLVMIENQTKDKKKKDLYKRIVYELNTGANFSEALARQGNVFPKLLINMLKTSELTGNLTESLDDMAAYYKTADSNRKQVISALTYPSVVLVISIAVLTFLLIFIIPKFQNIFDQLGSNLPGITLFLINMSTFLQNNVIKIVLAIFASIIIIVMLYRHVKKFRYCVQWVAMHIPVIKDVLIDNEVVMFTKTFSSLIRHDVFITDSMEILSKITNNEVYKRIINKCLENLAKGDSVSSAFRGEWAIPVVAYEMIVTGESTGQLGNMMDKVASHFQMLHKNVIDQMKSLVEPILICFLAVVVGVILVSIVEPMFSIYSQIK